jgi:hypothetical protein
LLTADGQASAARTPGVLGFSKRLEELLPMFESQCAFTHLHTYEARLLTEPEALML